LPALVESAVGKLGWLDTPLSPVLIIFMYIALAWLTLAYGERVNLRWWPRLLAALVVIGSIGSVITAHYLVWYPVGNHIMEGLQGRYFLPIALLFCVIFHRQGAYKVQAKWMLALLCVISFYAVWVVIERYYLPPGIIANVLNGTKS
jgi:uncharacterized membrane protein